MRAQKRMQGLLHVHSTFSYDGRHTIGDLGRICRQRGYHFVAIADHSDTLDPMSMRQLVRSCREATGKDLLVLPGVEFSCSDGVHVLGLGIERMIPSNDPVEVAQFIASQGGVAVLAHPVKNGYRIPSELISHLHGIEVWNVVYDGGYVPRARTMEFFRRLRSRDNHLYAFAGTDLHRIYRRDKLVTVIPGAPLEQEPILHSLRRGEYFMSGHLLNFNSVLEMGVREEFVVKTVRVIYHAAATAKQCLSYVLTSRAKESDG